MVQPNIRTGKIGSLALLVTLTLSAFCLHASNEPRSGSVWIRQSGFQELRHGTVGDSGANLYVSFRGRIQTINRWDLNLDGEVDLLFTQDHNEVYAPDSLIYWGGNDGFASLLPDMWQLRAPFSLLTAVEASSNRITRLPTLGGGRSQIADLNGDGYLDIVFCNFMHNYRPDQPAYIYWGSASGFKPTARAELPAYLASGVAVGDLNGDGLLDVVLANRGDESGEQWGFRFHLESYIYWGDLNGFQVSRRTSIPTVSAGDVTIGDFNGDKFPDLAFVNYNTQEQSVYVYWGEEGGNYSERRRQVLSRADLHLAETTIGRYGSAIGMETLHAADLDADGFVDLVVAGTERALVFYGSSTGLESRPSPDLPTLNCRGVEAADLNRDGYPDLIFANEGNLDESPPGSTIFWGSQRGYSPESRTELPTLGATTVKAADFNQDGFLDILFGNARDRRSNDVPSYIYWGGPNGYASYKRTELLGFGVGGGGVADFNQDGRPDILLVSHLSGTGASPSVIFWGNPDHYYSSSSATLLDPGGEMEYSVADLDDDNYPDIIFARNGAANVWWGSPNGFSAHNQTRLLEQRVMSSSVADFNRDGFLDVLFTVWGDRTSGKCARAVIAWGNAQRFRNLRTTEFELLAETTQANTIADLNRDGYLDLIFPHRITDFAEIWWGSQQGYVPEKVTKIEANGPPHAVPADLDGDGWLDLILTNSQTPSRQTTNTETFVYWGSKTSFSQASRTSLQGFVPLDATVADFNRDGHLDIAMTNYQSDTTRDLPVFIYWGGPGRHFSEKRRTFLVAASSSAIDALDLNRDGWPDLVVSNHQTNFDHAAGTNIYWGGPDGFSWSRRTHLSTVGVHLDTMVDAGNIYTRRCEWDYISKPLEAPPNARFSRLHWSAETKFGSGVKFQVRSASTRDGLEKAVWQGPESSETFYKTSGAQLGGVPGDHRWLQFRSVLTSPDGGSSPLLTEIALECSRQGFAKTAETKRGSSTP